MLPHPLLMRGSVADLRHKLLEQPGLLQDCWKHFFNLCRAWPVETDLIAWDPCAEDLPVLMRLRDDARLLAVTRACIGDDFDAPNSLVMLATGGGRGQTWHQDCPPREGQFNLNLLFYPRCDFGRRRHGGASRLAPHGLDPPGAAQERMANEVALMPRAGTLVLLHGHVFHRVTPNLSGKPRLSVNFRAFPPTAAPEVCNVGVYRNGAVNFQTGERMISTPNSPRLNICFLHNCR